METTQNANKGTPKADPIMRAEHILEEAHALQNQMPITASIFAADYSPFEYPKWSVDHELRINGRAVDKITNKLNGGCFKNVQLKAGDKITACSMWKNGYGAVAEVFDYCEPDVAEVGKISYVVNVYRDSTEMSAKEERLAKIKKCIKMAESMADEQKFDDAMAILKDIGKNDREWLAWVVHSINVEDVEKTIREKRAKANRMKPGS
jgi:hypothetical protein